MLDHVKSLQLVLYAAVFVVVWIAERAVTQQPTLAKLRHTLGNAIFVTGALPIQFAMMLLCLALARWTQVHHIGLAHLLPDQAWIRYGLMFVVLDGLDYLYHVLMHRVPALWRFHHVHHTDQSVDISTTLREHPGETFIRNAFLMLCVVACGASPEVLVLRQTVDIVVNLAVHSSLRLAPLPARIAGWLFVTADLHHAHHHCRLPATNCNYGDVFSFWDRLFGTYIEMAPQDIVCGLDSHMPEVLSEPDTFLAPARTS